MPEISRFYGIIIKMYFGDHNPPHFHVEYGDDGALISINTLGVIAGNLPPSAERLVAGRRGRQPDRRPRRARWRAGTRRNFEKVK